MLDVLDQLGSRSTKTKKPMITEELSAVIISII